MLQLSQWPLLFTCSGQKLRVRLDCLVHPTCGPLANPVCSPFTVIQNSAPSQHPGSKVFVQASSLLTPSLACPCPHSPFSNSGHKWQSNSPPPSWDLSGAPLCLTLTSADIVSLLPVLRPARHRPISGHLPPLCLTCSPRRYLSGQRVHGFRALPRVPSSGWPSLATVCYNTSHPPNRPNSQYFLCFPSGLIFLSHTL